MVKLRERCKVAGKLQTSVILQAKIAELGISIDELGIELW
jgi:hypothetical protein